jgi:adenine-specific DNA-methyltransferase
LHHPGSKPTLVHRPEQVTSVTRVTGPFAFEATIPTPVESELDAKPEVAAPGDAGASFAERMLEVLRRSPLLRLEGNREVR